MNALVFPHPQASMSAAIPAARSSTLSASEIDMRQSGVIRRQAGVKFRQLSVGERIAAFLRGRHPERTAANVAADTRGRISGKTVEKLLERLSAPSLPTWFVLVETYGPELTCAVMENPPAWLTEAGRAQARLRLDAEIAKLEALRKEIA